MRLSRKQKRILWTVLLLAAAAAMIVLAIWVVTSKPQTSSEIGAGVLMQVTAEIIPNQQTVLRLPSMGVTVYVPENAIDVEGYLSLTPREANLFPDAGREPGWIRPRIVSLELFDPTGRLLSDFRFTKPIEICFRLSSGLWEQYEADRGLIAVEFYDEFGSAAIMDAASEAAREETSEICGRMNHLTLIALAMKQVEIQPTPALPPYDLY